MILEHLSLMLSNMSLENKVPFKVRYLGETEYLCLTHEAIGKDLQFLLENKDCTVTELNIEAVRITHLEVNFN